MTSIIRSLSYGLISLFLTSSSHSILCYADEGVCDVSSSGGDNKACLDPSSNLKSDDNDKEYDLVQAMVSSLQERKGGFFDGDKIEIRRRTPTDASSPLGIFAKEDIEADELLMKFPPESLIRINSTGTYDDDTCVLKDALMKELNDGEDSEFKAYIDFLLLQPETIPAAWSDFGQFLLNRMLVDMSEGVNRQLPPLDATKYYDINCVEEEDDEEEQLLWMTIMRGYDFLMAPVYDIINHSNGEINIKSTSIRRKDGFKVSASKAIKMGDELLHSYDRCLDCDGDSDMFGTPELFRSTGFIEDFPQRFEISGGAFEEEDTSFDIIKKNNTLKVEWLKKPFFNGSRLQSMKIQLERLDKFRTDRLLPAISELDKMEWNLLNKYFETLTVALSLAVSEAELDDFEEVYDSGYDAEEEYTLPEDQRVFALLDKHRDSIYQSETLVWATDHFELIDALQSEYQGITYFKEPGTKDVCFFIDGVFQMCGSYWPYYHEMQVHKAAKYVKEDIKRVLFVGAGDNGLLNEIVKYPSLELVVGLELDQHVSRMAFKHLAAKPHFDNPKVQWWFGDASKTLFMLPKEYFGSFDMVLVDLSDTVLSLTVSGELDVVGALSLLLRPGGVFAMNELFFQRVSNVFKYAVYYQFTGVPKVLDQGFVFASNDIDLLYQDLTDHKIEDVHIEDSILQTDHRFRHVHDYRRNPNSSSRHICKDPSKGDTLPIWQEASPGIFMAIEAEALQSTELGSRHKIQSTIESALTKTGFHVLESTDDDMTDHVFVTVMEEGYVTVRLHENEKYVAFDTLLWSRFNFHESLKKVLVESVGGSIRETSSFRIVTGGMFGTKSWFRDRKSHGPEIVKKCIEPVETKFAEPMNLFPIALDGSIDLIQDKGSFAVAILCPAEGEPCQTEDLLEKNSRISSVLTFQSCSEGKSLMDDKICNLENAVKRIDTFFSSAASSKIRAIVVDPGCPQSMEDIPLMLKEKDKFESNILAMATINSRKDLWRRQVVDRIRRKVVPMDPVFRAHVGFNSTSDQGSRSSMELAMVSSGDVFFMEHLRGSVTFMEEKSGFDLHVSNVIGGLWRSTSRWVFPDREASKLFYPEDYDHSSSMEQYLGQMPLGIQTVVQFQNLAPLEIEEEVKYTLYFKEEEDTEEATFKSTVKAMNNDGAYYTVYDLFGEDLDLPRSRFTSTRGDRFSNLTATAMKDLLIYVFRGENQENPMYINTIEGIGEGLAFVAIWEDGQAVLIWDGRHTVTANIYCEELETYQIIQLRILDKLPTLKVGLLDMHPRGFGHVVNFATDMAKHPTPHWYDDVPTDDTSVDVGSHHEPGESDSLD